MSKKDQKVSKKHSGHPKNNEVGDSTTDYKSNSSSELAVAPIPVNKKIYNKELRRF